MKSGSEKTLPVIRGLKLTSLRLCRITPQWRCSSARNANRRRWFMCGWSRGSKGERIDAEECRDRRTRAPRLGDYAGESPKSDSTAPVRALLAFRETRANNSQILAAQRNSRAKAAVYG